MATNRNVVSALTWFAGILSFVVSYVGLMSFAFTPWEGMHARIEMVGAVLIGVSLLVSFPLFLLFRRWRGLAISLQWSAVIICIASVDAGRWGRSQGVIANLFAAFSIEDIVFAYPLLPAVLLSILYWFCKTPRAVRETISVPR